jgi:hypothetical protein
MLLYQGVLNIVGAILAILVWARYLSGFLDSVCGVAIVSGALTMFIVARRERQFSNLTASIVFAANLIPVYLVLWASQTAMAAGSVYWVPFQPHGLSSLTIAILAPPVAWIGALAVAAPAVLAIIQYMNFSPEQIAWLPPDPVFLPSAFGAFAVVLYFFRLRSLSIAEFAARKDAEAEMMKKMTRTVLAIKDLANSPIQALTLDAETLKRKDMENAAIALRIEQATAQLRKLNRVLDECLRGSPKGDVVASFDPYAELDTRSNAVSHPVSKD